MMGLLVLSLGQVASAIATTPTMLYFGRAIAGLGGALVTATGLALVSAAASPENRAAAIGAWSAIGAVGAALGPLIGGVITEVFSWRWLFFLAAPLALIIGVAARWEVEESRDENMPGGSDVLGAILVTAGIALVVYGGTEGSHTSWGRPEVVITMGLGIACLLLFGVLEARSSAPLVPSSILRNRSFSVAGTVAFISNAAFAAAMFFMTLYLQQIYGLGPIATGVVFLAMTGPLMGLSPFLGRFVSRLGQRGVMTVGMAVLVASFVGSGGR